MIIKGKSRSNAAQAGSYLLKQGKNERVELIETSGTFAQDVKGACLEMEAVAAGANAEKPFYHASISPANGERLTPEQWEFATELLEKKLGLEGHQRIIVEHEKGGEIHRHFFWNRVNQETLVASRMSWNYVQHEKTAREIENTFGLQKVQGVHTLENGELRSKGDPRASYAPSHKETAQSKRTGVNLYKWQQEIQQLAAFAEGGSGAELIAILESKGHMVAKGDNVAFVILDPSGKPHRMAQRLGMGVGELKDRLADIDREALPDAEKAREHQKEQQATREGAGLYDHGGMASQQKDAIRHAIDRFNVRQQAQPESGAIGKGKEDRGGISLDQMLLQQARQRAGKDGNAEPLQYQPLKDKDGKPVDVTLDQYFARQAQERAANNGNAKAGQYDHLKGKEKTLPAAGKEKGDKAQEREGKRAGKEMTERTTGTTRPIRTDHTPKRPNHRSAESKSLWLSRMYLP